MSEQDPLSEAAEVSREERLLARLNGLIQYQSDLLDKVRRNRFRPYCHIPDLFGLDPEASRPYSVPSTFISEQVGGNVSVVNASGGFLDSEPLDLMLGSFLPGGYKRRWSFEIWTGDFSPASRSGFADVADGFRFRTSSPLSDIVTTGETERYTPFEHPVDDVTVYIPRELVVWNPSVGEDREIVHYYWDESNGVVRNRNVDDVPDEELRELKSDPTSQFLWFKHPLQFSESNETCDLSTITHGLLSRAKFDDDAVFLKSYYATLLTLYGEEETFSEVIRYRHEANNMTAFVGSREESQALLFEVDQTVLGDLLDEVFKPDTALYRDLQFSLLYRRLWDQLFFQEEALDHAFSVKPFYRTLVAVDYTLATASDGPDSVFDATIDEIESRFESLLPAEDRRLGLLDYDSDQLASYVELLREHEETLTRILDECASSPAVRSFTEHVLVHSLKHGLASWAAEYSAGGGDFEAWYDVNFVDASGDSVEIGIYDSIQGGAGASREVFDDLMELDDRTLLDGLASQASCHIAAAEETLLHFLSQQSGEYVFDVAEMLETAGDDTARLENTFEKLGIDFDESTYDDVKPLLYRRLDRLAETREMARFYATIADTYTETREQLQRTPRPVDILFALEDRTFFDTRVRETYRRFAMRRSQRRDLSELAERVEEVTKQCIHACPDCLKRESCMHQYRYQEQMLDRRLLARSIAALRGN